MTGSQLIGLCGHPEIIARIVGASFDAMPRFRDAWAASGSAWMQVRDSHELAELRRNGGLLVAIVTNNMPADARKLAEHADRTISGRTVHLGHFSKVCREIIYGRPPINRDDPRQVRPL